jgi:hypothetical protein
MAKWFGATALAVASLVGASLAVTSAFSVPASARAAVSASVAAQQAQAAHVSDVSARRHHRPLFRDVSRPAYSSYYGRPYYYAPAPFFPIPPFFGYGWEPY